MEKQSFKKKNLLESKKDFRESKVREIKIRKKIEDLSYPINISFEGMDKFE